MAYSPDATTRQSNKTERLEKNTRERDQRERDLQDTIDGAMADGLTQINKVARESQIVLERAREQLRELERAREEI